MGSFVFFLRVSTQKQSIESQYDEMLRFAQTYYNINESDVIRIEYKESGRTLSEEERAGIADFKKLYESGTEITACFVSELSRIARKANITHNFTEYLHERGIQLICKNPHFELLDANKVKTATASLTLGVFSALAEQEMIEKRFRFARGKERKAKEGKWSGGAIPFGYTVDASQDNLIIENPEEASVIREIFNLYEQGLSQARIAVEFQSRGNKRITISLVHQILTNILLTGAPHKSKGASYQRQYPQIISTEQFERCRQIASENTTKSPITKYVHYSDGLIKCHLCGKNFVSTGNRASYHCQDAHNLYKRYENQPTCTNRISISGNVMDSLLWHVAQICETLFLTHEARELREGYEDKLRIIHEKIQGVDIRLADVNEKKDRIVESYLDNIISKSKRDEKLEKVNNERKVIEKELFSYKEEKSKIETLLAQVIERERNYNADELCDTHDKIAKSIASISDDLTRRDIIHRHIKKVTVTNTTIFHKYFAAYPDGKETKAKEIIIETDIESTPKIFYYLPFCGRSNGLLLEKNYHTREESRANLEYINDLLHLSTNVDNIMDHYEPYIPCDIPIINRIVRKSKLEQKRKRAEDRENYFKRMSEEGYISVKEMMEGSGLSQNSLLYAINIGKFGNGIKKYSQWWVKEEAFYDYLLTYHLPQLLQADGYITIKEMMEISGYSFDKVRYSIMSNKLESSIKRANKWWVKEEEYRAYLQKKR